MALRHLVTMHGWTDDEFNRAAWDVLTAVVMGTSATTLPERLNEIHALEHQGEDGEFSPEDNPQSKARNHKGQYHSH
jgi:hypothetical protein